jgi:hypothetical protein
VGVPDPVHPPVNTGSRVTSVPATIKRLQRRWTSMSPPCLACCNDLARST